MLHQVPWTFALIEKRLQLIVLRLTFFIVVAFEGELVELGLKQCKGIIRLFKHTGNNIGPHEFMFKNRINFNFDYLAHLFNLVISFLLFWIRLDSSWV